MPGKKQDVSGVVQSARLCATCRHSSSSASRLPSFQTLLLLQQFCLLPRVRVTFGAASKGTDTMMKLHSASCCELNSLLQCSPARSRYTPTNRKPISFLICSMFGPGKGFVIRSAGFKLVPCFFVTKFPDFEASCIHKICIPTCFAFPSPPQFTQHVIAAASRCRFNPHTIPKSFAPLWISRPSDAVLTAASSSLFASGRWHHLLLLGPYLQTVSTSHDHSS